MSTLPDNELDLEKLFLPAWAQEPSSSKNYENYRGEDRAPRGREGDAGRRPRRPGQFGDRPRPGQGRPEGRRTEGQPGQGGQGQFRGPRPQGGERRGGDHRQDDRRQGGRFQQPRREAPPPLAEITVSLIPDERGVDSLARQIKMTGRAYPLFDIAQMILQKPERHNVTFSTKKDAAGKLIQPLFVCALDESLWLSEEEAVDHVLKRHFATFYQADRTATEPPKGKYTFVAQCGMSGVILGPPNHHDYQNQLRKLHADRFSRMPFDMYKSRVKIVKDEEVVKKWVEDQSWKTEYVCLNMPEPLRLQSMEAVAQHFRETHREAMVKEVETCTIPGSVARNLRSPELSRAFRSNWEDQRRFPLQIATVLSQQFASRGLQFFKVNKTVTHVSVARPHYLDLEATPVSEGVRKIVEFLNAHGKASRRQLIDALAPAPALKPVLPPPPASAASVPEVQTSTQESAEGEQAAPVPPAQPEPSPEQNALISDLHWLIHQGHVIEFANGIMETAKKPLPKPVKPEKKQAAAVEAPNAPAPEGAVEAPAGNAETPVSVEEPAEAVQAEPQPPSAQEGEPAAEGVAEVLSPSADAPQTQANDTAAEPSKAPEEAGETPPSAPKAAE